MIDLDELERLEKAATPGPWGFRTVDIADPDHIPDAALIAAMRNALPELLRELKVARGCVAVLRQYFERDREALMGAALAVYDGAVER